MQQIIIRLPMPTRPGTTQIVLDGVLVASLIAREVIETTGEEIPAPPTGYLRLLPGGRAA